MFIVPLVSLVALWVFAAKITITAAVGDNATSAATSSVSKAVAPFAQLLPQERNDAYLLGLSGGAPVPFGSGGKMVTPATLRADQAATDHAQQNLVSVLEAQENSSFDSDAKAQFALLQQQFADVASIRQQAQSGVTPTLVFSEYDKIMDQLFTFMVTDSQSFPNSLLAVQAGAVDSLASLDQISREAALVNGSFIQGQLTPDARELFVTAVADRLALDNNTQTLIPTTTINLSLATNTPAYAQFLQLETVVLNSTGTAVPVQPSAWGQAIGTYLPVAAALTLKNAEALSAKNTQVANGLVTEAILAGGLGLLAIVISIASIAWFGRRATGDLGRLNTRVRYMAEESLPRVVSRLRAGEDVDVKSESPTADGSNITEIHDIAQSFATVQDAAVAAAVDQARLRKGVSQLFLNISMRNQSLLHRQLGMLDTMERRTSDPDALAELFRLDHLTTRMRRHAEGLIILAGSTPGRAWRDPVLALDVLRAAVAEVEDYVRVDVTSDSRDLVAGTAVNDIIHLVAELVENAAVFSPPHTRVEVRAERVGTGLIAEVEDRGLGLTEAERSEINARLAQPPELDLTTSDQLGLFIVSQLASRHGVKVSLRESIYGGTTAVIRMPFGVIVREEDVQADGDRGGATPMTVPAAQPQTRPASEPARAATVTADPEGDVEEQNRLQTGATGRIATDGEVTGAPATPSGWDTPTPRTMPRAPWELGRTEPQPKLTSPPAVSMPAAPAATASAWAQPEPTPASPAANGAPSGGPASRGPSAGSSSGASSGTFAFFRSASSAGSSQGVPSPASAPSRGSFAARPSPATALPAGGAAGNHLGMPIRVPQASMAPQLRDKSPSRPGDVPDEVDTRAPETTRDLFSSLQDGWQRGRVDDLDDPIGSSGNETDR